MSSGVEIITGFVLLALGLWLLKINFWSGFKEVLIPLLMWFIGFFVLCEELTVVGGLLATIFFSAICIFLYNWKDYFRNPTDPNG